MSVWHELDRVVSLPLARPLGVNEIAKNQEICLDENGHLQFSPDDVENPKNWSVMRRSWITFVAVVLVLNATFASSSPSGCLGSISRHFGVSEEAANLVTTLFLLGYCAGPLLWGPLSEFYGRRYVFYSTFIIYMALNFACAFTPTFAGLLVGRFLTGTFASAALSNSPGVLADLWGPIERGIAMALFAMTTFIGPALGPITSGFLEMTENWRWAFYVLIWLSFGTLLALFTIPETLPSQALVNKARRIRAEKIPGFENVQAPVEVSDRSLKGIFKEALTRPWILLFDPIAFLTAIYMSIVYALVYMLFTIYPIVFQEMRGWNPGVGELPLLGLIVGAYIGGAGVIYEATLARKKVLKGVKLQPEDRMPLAMIGAIGFPITLFWFAWSGNFNSVHWIVPTLAGVFLDASIVLIFVSYLNYLTDTYLMNVASVMAGNTIMRSAFGAAAPLFTEYMFSALGVGGAGSLIAGVACLMAPIPFLFYRYGDRIRKRSKFAPTEIPERNSPRADGNENQPSEPMPRESSERVSKLDKEPGGRSSEDLEKDLEKEVEPRTPLESSGHQESGDRFANANDMEKAEWKP